MTNEIVQLPVMHSHVASYFSEGCAGISCQVAIGLPAVQLFAGKLDPPRDLLLFQLLGCGNILKSICGHLADKEKYIL